MSLSEKAKTGREICDSIMAFYKELGITRTDGKLSISLEEFKRRELEEWVRLEVHQQEIDRLIEQRNIESGIVDRMQRERGEQKQKVREWWEKEFGNFLLGKQDLEHLKRKFKELVKE